MPMRTFFYGLILLLSLRANAQAPRLWGMTGAFDQLQQYGTIFSIGMDGSDYQIEYVFSPADGYDNQGGLCLAPNGKLYGATHYGGLYDHGTLFSFDPNSGEFEKIFDIDYGDQIGPTWCTPLLASDGYLYGAGVANMYRIDPATDEVFMLPPYNVNESLVQAPEGWIYGAEVYGGFNGSFGDGLIFRYDPTSTQVEELYEMGPSDGHKPYGKLCLAENGKLYGVTHDGGYNDEGVVYEFDRTTEEHSTVANFGLVGGAACWAGFISAGPDLLLNTTVEGGTYNDGTICSFRPSTNTLAVVHSFDQNAFPFGGLLQASNGWIYGMTNNGGNGSGTIYRFDTTNYEVDVIFEFPGAMDGHSPNAELIEVGGSVGAMESGNGDLQIRVHPNPTSGITKLVMGNDGPGRWVITLCDPVGRSLWTRNVTSKDEMIQLPQQRGMYLLKVSGEGGSKVLRIVVE